MCIHFNFCFRMFLFRQPFLMVADPDMIKDILIKEFPKFHDRRVIKDCTIKLIVVAYTCLITFNSRGCSTSKIGAMSTRSLVDFILCMFFCFKTLKKVLLWKILLLFSNLDNTVPK